MQYSLSNKRFRLSRGVWWLALLLLPMLALGAWPQSVGAQSNTLHFDRYDVDITVNPDSSLDIVETVGYVFDFGSFKRGTREIFTDRVEGITNVRVSELTGGAGETPYRQTSFNEDDDRAFAVEGTYGTKQVGDKLRVRWIFDETSFGRKTFKLSYRVTGGMRVYEDRDELQWKAVPHDAPGEILSSRVTAKLPSGNYDINNLQAESKPNTTITRSTDTLTWSRGSVTDGLEIRFKLPKGLVQATKSGWQEGVDSQERIEPFINLGFTLVGGLILIGGPLWAFRRWYKYGRDLPVGLHADYVADPPSDLPPGLVGTLLDESADVRDVIATIVDQGAKGNLLIKQTEGEGFLANKDFEYEQTGREVSYRFEEMVHDAVFSRGNPVHLSDLKNSFYKDLPPIYAEMYRTLVGLKYFPEDPSAVRTRSVLGGIGFLVLGALVVGAQFVFAEGITLFPMIPAVGLVVTGVVRLAMSRHMPRKTDFGAEQAQRWRAFKRYLEEMKSYTNVEAAADKFQKYLPYAVALGVEKELTQQFQSVPSAMPPYYVPYGWYPYPMGGGHMTAGPGGTGGGGNVDMGQAMQGMSDSFAGAMQGMSDSFSSMVNSASSALTSQPSSSGSSGGGWGGGGGSSFGGGGGGGSIGAD